MAFLTGLSAFPITPSDANGRVDVSGLRHLLSRLTAATVDSIGLLGSTGSYAYLSREERRRPYATPPHCAAAPTGIDPWKTLPISLASWIGSPFST
jgi:4-hydroxy-tetrahydrodipicolinate synthase